VVAGEDMSTLERVADAYGAVVPAGIHRAPSIEVAEAAKVLENTQRDINIALMNELALILDRLGLRSADVLAAAATKWNFMRFTPGLVGGHCIGVDPFYLTAKAEAVGYLPQVILAGRRINDSMGGFVAQRLVKLLIAAGRPVRGARVGILGLAFKENVPDLRNSRVPDIATELRGFAIEAMVHDPLIEAAEARREYGIELASEGALAELDALVIAVPHRSFLDRPLARYLEALVPGGVVVDVKSALDPRAVPAGITYWSL
jgi:UDP-N-acetyl-D-galactosamine dehydrogenase